jgi:hypothetical protein
MSDLPSEYWDQKTFTTKHIIAAFQEENPGWTMFIVPLSNYDAWIFRIKKDDVGMAERIISGIRLTEIDTLEHILTRFGQLARILN